MCDQGLLGVGLPSVQKLILLFHFDALVVAAAVVVVTSAASFFLPCLFHGRGGF